MAISDQRSAISDQRSAISQSNTFYNLDNKITSYEIPIYSKQGTESGSIIVNVDKNSSVISSYGTHGASFSHELKSYTRELESTLSKEGIEVVETRLYELDVAEYVVGLKLKGNTSSLKKYKNTPKIGDFYVFSPFPIEFDFNTPKPSHKRVQAELLDEINLYRNALINKDFSSYLFNLEKSARIKGTLNDPYNDTQSKMVQYAGGNVYNLLQENRAWTKGGLIGGTCYAGCTPVAWAMVMEYGDRYGFPNLIGSATNNNHPDASHADLRYAINELRGYMSTSCVGTNKAGSTSIYNAPNGILYAKARGYPNFSVSNSTIFFIWDNLVAEINASRPVVTAVSKAPNGAIGGHSVVSFGYDDNTGSANDYAFVKTGWSTPAERAYSRADITAVTAIIPSR
ncbi:C39 family peptidase [uncultured Thiothrix sp.]|uniref:C39 family peptidase n=1 Tax=uncultured Thiothrix sp. TaxID=223185 RepID=UPI00260767B9|nr:C39 family peptidase [uncultured Thiothrix sp.]